jgi:hypothetical protein
MRATDKAFEREEYTAEPPVLMKGLGALSVPLPWNAVDDVWMI